MPTQTYLFKTMCIRLFRNLASAATAIVLLSLGESLLSSPTAQAVSYTVGTAPCDTTIQACINLAANGDTIIIPAGTYTESLTLGKAVNLAGAGSATTIINAVANQGVITVTGAVISNTTISSLTLTKGNATNRSGGAVWVTGAAQPTFENVVITDNFTAYGGGGLANVSIITLTNVTISSNLSFGGGGGGGVSNQTNARMYLLNVTIENNRDASSPGYGGGISNNGGTMILVNVTVNNNQARFGAGIANPSGSMTLTNVTINGNSFGSSYNSGGGIYNSGTMTLTNATIAGNSATGGGFGGISNGGTLTLRNTIAANNTGGNCGNPITDGGGNLQFNPDTGCGSIPAGDPKLGPLTNNGGSTKTMALLPGSAAIDAANPVNCPAIDQRGVARFGICDIGAYEAIMFVFMPLVLK